MYINHHYFWIDHPQIWQGWCLNFLLELLADLCCRWQKRSLENVHVLSTNMSKIVQIFLCHIMSYSHTTFSCFDDYVKIMHMDAYGNVYIYKYIYNHKYVLLWSWIHPCGSAGWPPFLDTVFLATSPRLLRLPAIIRRLWELSQGFPVLQPLAETQGI